MVRPTARIIPYGRRGCNLPGVPAPNAVVVKEFLQTAGGEFGGFSWKWREFEEIPKPCLVNARAELQRLRVVAGELSTKLIDEPRVVLAEIVIEARKFAEVENRRVLNGEGLEEM